jgi:hypothetical protein
MSALCVVCSTEKKHVQAQPNRNICFRDGSNLLRFVNEIEGAVLTIRRGAGGMGDRHAPGFGSQSPAWDDVIAATDYRSLPGQVVREILNDRGEIDYEDDEEMNAFARSILASLHGISRVIAEERGRQWPKRITVESECRFIRAHLDWYAAQPDIDELYADLKELHGYVQALDQNGEHKPKMVGKCPHLLKQDYCGNRLYAPPNGDTIKCSKCGRQWPRDEWLRLGRLLDSA